MICGRQVAYAIGHSVSRRPAATGGGSAAGAGAAAVAGGAAVYRNR